MGGRGCHLIKLTFLFLPCLPPPLQSTSSRPPPRHRRHSRRGSSSSARRRPPPSGASRRQGQPPPHPPSPPRRPRRGRGRPPHLLLLWWEKSLGNCILHTNEECPSLHSCMPPGLLLQAQVDVLAVVLLLCRRSHQEGHSIRGAAQGGVGGGRRGGGGEGGGPCEPRRKERWSNRLFYNTWAYVKGGQEEEDRASHKGSRRTEVVATSF